MSERLLPIDKACQEALAAIERDPLDPPAEVLAHLRHCPACAEARVHWLAQEDAPPVLVPGQYFQTLPERIQRKLPPRPVSSPAPALHGALWATAAALLLAAGITGFWAGKNNRTPMVEAAATPKTSPEAIEVMPDAPFQDSENPVSQLHELSPDEARKVLKRLDSNPKKP